MIGKFPEVLTFNQLFLKLDRFNCNQRLVLPIIYQGVIYCFEVINGKNVQKKVSKVPGRNDTVMINHNMGHAQCTRRFSPSVETMSVNAYLV